MQHIYDDMEFRSPFFLTYLTNSLLIIYLPLWQLWIICGAVAKKAISKSADTPLPTPDMDDILNDLHDDAFSNDISNDAAYNQIPNYSSHAITPPPKEAESQSYTHWDVIQVAMVIAPLYVLSNGLYNYSLIMTSVSSSTIIRYNVNTEDTDPASFVLFRYSALYYG